MAMNERLRYFRHKRKMSATQLGMKVGFPLAQADGRITQYETKGRTPSNKYILLLADSLHISPKALSAPTFETEVDILHILFALEDIYGLTVHNLNNINLLCVDGCNEKAKDLSTLISLWNEKRNALLSGAISLSEYNDWKWNFE